MIRKKKRGKHVPSRVDLVGEALAKVGNLEKAERLELARTIIKRLDKEARDRRNRTIKKLKEDGP